MAISTRLRDSTVHDVALSCGPDESVACTAAEERSQAKASREKKAELNVEENFPENRVTFLIQRFLVYKIAGGYTPVGYQLSLLVASVPVLKQPSNAFAIPAELNAYTAWSMTISLSFSRAMPSPGYGGESYHQ
nr:hypothetical protein [Herbaspirillum seropedicae]